jgi:enoyl-CoA hydratase/crotonobetainyl-CoA hydratase
VSGAVRVDIDASVAVVTIDRPAVRNAVDRATAQLLADAMDLIDGDSSVRAAVLTGAGGFFSAGMDLKALARTGERPIVEGRGAFGLCERPTDKPLIAAVEGKALGGGLEIALACDLIVAARDAQFGLPEVKRGQVAAAGGVLRLPRTIPPALAAEMVLTGEPIDAARAFQCGLVSRVADTGAVLQSAIGLARSIASNAPLAVQASKQLLVRSRLWPDEEMFDRQRPYADPVRASADAAEGAAAFLERRAPVWSAR